MNKDLGNSVSIDYEQSDYSMTGWSNFDEVDAAKEAGIDAFTKPICDPPTFDVDTDGTNIFVKSVSGKIRITKTSSWVVKSKQSANLLEHEQGHYYISYITYTLMLKEIKKLTVPLSSAGINPKAPDQVKQTMMKNAIILKVQPMVTAAGQTMSKLNKEYDAESAPGTNHGLNRDEQAKWNTKFSTALSSGTAL